MQAFEPDFELIKMDAEVGSYQEDDEPAPAPPDLQQPAPSAPAERSEP